MEGFRSYSRPSSFPVLLTLPDCAIRERGVGACDVQSRNPGYKKLGSPDLRWRHAVLMQSFNSLSPAQIRGKKSPKPACSRLGLSQACCTGRMGGLGGLGSSGPPNVP